MVRSRLPAVLLLALPLVLASPARAGGPLTSGVPVVGTLPSGASVESWTFSGTAGQRVLVAAVTTSGALNTQTVLKAPGGTVLINTAADRWDYQLVNTGTFTLEVSDNGSNDAGGYILSFVNLTTGPYTHAGDLDGGAIASGEVRAGTTGGVADFDVFTFSGTAGQRVLFAALESSGAPYNTTINVYPPAGGSLEYGTGSGNRGDFQLAATGTYTVVVEDVGNDAAGGYTVSFLNVSAGPLTTGPDPDGGAIASGATASGTMNGVVDFDAFTFSGTTGDRILVAGVTTSGAMNTTMYLYPPNGGSPQVATAADRWDFQLTQTGTHTVVFEDNAFGDTGTYTLGLVNTTAGPLTNAGDLDGGAIASGEVRAGTTGGVADFDVFTFSGTAGQRVLFAALESSGAPYNTTINVYPPAGGSLEYGTGSGNRGDFQLAATGTYTVVVEDVGNDAAGGYTVSFLNVSAGPLTTGPDPDGGAIASGATASGTMNGVVDFDAFTFSGTTGDRILVAGVTTSGAMNTTMYLYPPNGGSPQVATAADRWDFQLTQTGTHTVVFEDNAFGDTGTYTLGLVNLTAGPLTHAGDLDGGPIASGEVRAGTTGGVADFDVFTFSGTAGQRVLLAALESFGAPYNTTINVYPPAGGSLEYGTGSGNRGDFQLAATGTYTVVVEDVGNDTAGGYTVSFLNVSAGPLTTGPDPDGGAIASGATASGTMNGVVDFDAFTFSGTTGDRILVAGVTTSGAMNTTMYLYPPNGGSPQVATAADRWDFQLTQTGTHTVVFEDNAFGDTGTYTLGLVNLTAGPLTNAGDLDGGAIASGEVRAGTTGGVADFDVFTVTGAAGDRVVFAAIATGGASYNTMLTIYPPGGGTLVYGSGGGDRADYQLAAAGTYVVVLEDAGNDHTGGYSVCFANVTAGPLAGPGETDGGWIASGQTKTGSIATAPDMDLYWFNAQPGDTAKVKCTTTSGALNTTTYLYPPGGGTPVVATAADNWTYAILVGGRHTLLVQHPDLTLTGGYSLELTGPLTTVDVPGGPAAAPRLSLSAPHPNPSRGAASFTLALPARGRVEMRVYDVRGAHVRTVADGAFESGTHTLAWDGRGADGRRAPSGVYLVQVRTPGAAFTRRVVRIE